MPKQIAKISVTTFTSVSSTAYDTTAYGAINVYKPTGPHAESRILLVQSARCCIIWRFLVVFQQLLRPVLPNVPQSLLYKTHSVRPPYHRRKQEMGAKDHQYTVTNSGVGSPYDVLTTRRSVLTLVDIHWRSARVAYLKEATHTLSHCCSKH